MLYLHLIVVRS